MQKLLNTYRSDRDVATARKIRAYDRKHAMAACLLSREDGDLLADAIHHANREG